LRRHELPPLLGGNPEAYFFETCANPVVVKNDPPHVLRISIFVSPARTTGASMNLLPVVLDDHL